MIRKLTYQEICATRKSIEDAKNIAKFPISVMLNNIRSSYNVGSIFRTCDAASVKELILTGFTPFPPNDKIMKTALDATDSVLWRYEPNIMDAIKIEKAKSNKVIAVELTNKGRSYTSINATDFPLCFVLGNELTGIDDEVIAECDDAIEIPMFGVKHSLNVAVATGIVIFEAVKTIL